MSIDWVSRSTRSAPRVARVVDEERDVDDLLVHRHPVLRPEVVLAEQEPVVGRDDQRGVLPHVVPVEVVEDLAEQVVAERHEGLVVRPELGRLLRQLVHPPVAGPVADGAVPAGAERLLEAVGRIERLMRVEGLDLEKPVVGVAVRLEEVQARSNTCTEGKSFSSRMYSRLTMYGPYLRSAAALDLRGVVLLA